MSRLIRHHAVDGVKATSTIFRGAKSHRKIYLPFRGHIKK